MCLSLYLDLRRDPLIVSQRILRTQVDKHIREQAEAITTGEFEAIDSETAVLIEGLQTENGSSNGSSKSASATTDATHTESATDQAATD